MASTRVSACQRFVVIDGLHVDRTIYAALEAWAAAREVSIQHAIQLAICAFSDMACERDEPPIPRARASAKTRALHRRGCQR